MFKRSVAVAVLCVGALFVMAASALANTQDIIEPQHNPPVNLPPTKGDGWQAGTCLTDEPAGTSPFFRCSAETGAAFFKQAGGHPPVGFTQYTIQHEGPTA